MGWFEKSSKQTEHEYIQEHLSEYLDAQLLPEEDARVERHLASCQECQWNLETLRQTVQWVEALPAVPVPRMFTIPVPAQPEHTPRWRWSVPVLQAATAFVAVLLFFTIAGDLMITNLAPVREAPSAVMSEREAVNIQMVEATVQVEAVPVEAEAPQAAKAVEETLIPPEPEVSVPRDTAQDTPPTEPVRIAAETVSTPTAESGTMGGLGFAPPSEAEKDATSETDAVKPPPTDEAVGVVAMETSAAYSGTEAPPTPMPTISLATTMPPTVLAGALEAAMDALEEEPLDSTMVREESFDQRETLGVVQQPITFWLSVAEVALAVAFALLLTTTIVIMIQRRRAR